ncbi:hypothetical protein [Streptomyces avermitilis]|uniref:hypothetical protein n=1 Tax=Streptomyces avermitilis TaxID=33903 RepID=UPI0037125B97
MTIAASAEIFHSRIDSVGVVTMDDQRHGLAESAVEADEWITTAARKYGNRLHEPGQRLGLAA